MPPSGEVSMVDARDAYLAADMAEFGGRNQSILWNAFAGRGLGEDAVSAGVDDPDPKPSFESPHSREATVRFRPVDDDGDKIEGAQLFVGNYEARSVPVADTDPATETPDTFRIVAGRYSLISRADGFGMKRTTLSVGRGDFRNFSIEMETNLASLHNGAVATGDGTNHDNLIDDTEATNWASLDSPVAGKQVTVALEPDRNGHKIDGVQVSAMLRPADPNDPTDPPQSRFSALRQFKILTCLEGRHRDCSQNSHFSVVFTSRADAFPAIVPRPRAPELIMRSFSFREVRASHVRLVVVTNQCTGTPGYQGEQDADPANVTDCEDGSTQDDNVRAAELQVFED
jgi:extracellular elastinolytic metalloproteinase